MTSEPNEPARVSVGVDLSADVRIIATDDYYSVGDNRPPVVHLMVGARTGRVTASASTAEWPVIYRRLGDALRSAGVDLTDDPSDDDGDPGVSP